MRINDTSQCIECSTRYQKYQPAGLLSKKGREERILNHYNLLTSSSEIPKKLLHRLGILAANGFFAKKSNPPRDTVGKKTDLA
mmetsp:Transcript_5959/g.14939  ORF Transcript_5959/g.14939 Transcript_5959/m.14939 type:complete len:83 (+) Transcript_5959:124-372(+)